MVNRPFSVQIPALLSERLNSGTVDMFEEIKYVTAYDSQGVSCIISVSK